MELAPPGAHLLHLGRSGARGFPLYINGNGPSDLSDTISRLEFLFNNEQQPLIPIENVRVGVLENYGYEKGGVEAYPGNPVDATGGDLILTTGGNHLDGGSASTIDDNIAQFFSSYICPYTGSLGPGGEQVIDSADITLPGQ